jgi:Flp pilus assembly pilin Flp
MRTALARAAWPSRTLRLERFADVCGASLVEYALVLGIISIVAITALGLIGHNANSALSSAANSIAS